MLASRRGPIGRATRIVLTLLVAGLLLAPPAGVARAATGDEAVVSVRGSHHRRFDRLAIGWPTTAALRVERRGDVVRVALPGRGRLDLADGPARPGGRILGVEAAQGRDGTELLVRVRPGTGTGSPSSPGAACSSTWSTGAPRLVGHPRRR